MNDKLYRFINYVMRGVPNHTIEVQTAEIVDLNKLSGKTVFITGGSKGIGYAIAKKVIDCGGKAIITGRNDQDLTKACNELGESCRSLKFDVSEIHLCFNMLEKATEYFGPINCLVNNAGVSHHELSFTDVTENDWDDQVGINLKGTYFMTQAFVKYYLERKIQNGKIIMIASETAVEPSFRPYGITKAAIVSFTRWLSKEYIIKGLRVNAIAPGVTETMMTHKSTSGSKINPVAPGKRILNATEIAEVCSFLLSDASNCISGQVITCNEAKNFSDN